MGYLIHITAVYIALEAVRSRYIRFTNVNVRWILQFNVEIISGTPVWCIFWFEISCFACFKCRMSRRDPAPVYLSLYLPEPHISRPTPIVNEYTTKQVTPPHPL